tara:strand:- start:3209 stop:5302 length:2094 start_codon:yes stop_codon:yes gene_type:complete
MADDKKIISVELQTDKAVKSAKNLDKSITDLSATFEDIYDDLQPLSGRMGEMEDRMYELALAGKSSSKEFKDLETEVGKYKRTIQDVDLAVDAAAQTMGQKLGGSLEFASGAFTAIQGVTASFGVESAALEETLLKVQSAMAVTQSINSMREGYKSVTAIMGGLASTMAKTALGQKALNIAQAAGAIGMKILNAVMSANPVFLLIAAFVALAGAFAYFASSEEKAEAMSEKVNATYQDRLALLDKLAKAMARDNAQALKELELNGASEKELHDQRVKNLDSEEKLRKASAIAEKENVKGKQAAYRQALWEGNEELAKSIKEEISESRKRYRDLEGQHKDYVNNKKNENKEYDNKVKKDAEADKAKQAADYKASADKYKAFLQKKLSIQQEIEDIRLGLIEDGEFKEIEILNTNAKRKRDALIADTSVGQKQKAELLRWYDAQRQVDEQKIRDTYLQQELESYSIFAEEKAKIPPPDFAIPKEDAVDTEVQYEGWKQDELKRIRKEARKEEAAAHAAFMQDKIDKSAGYFEAASQSLSALDDLNSLLTDKAVKDAGSNEAAAEAARKKGFERSKKIQITMAVIQGIQGVMSAFTAGSSMGPAGVVMGPLMGALAAVTAGINIAKIKATSYQGGGGGSPSVPQSAPNPASFNVVGDSGTNQIAETLGQQNANPTKTYVVAGDVTSAQSLERNKIANASL